MLTARANCSTKRGHRHRHSTATTLYFRVERSSGQTSATFPGLPVLSAWDLYLCLSVPPCRRHRPIRRPLVGSRSPSWTTSKGDAKIALGIIEVAAEELSDVRDDYFGYHGGQPIAGASLSGKIVGGGLAQKLLVEAVQQRARSVITEAANRRRVELVRKSNRGTLSGDEAAELGRLQTQLDEHLERWDQELLAELARMEKAAEDLPAHER